MSKIQNMIDFIYSSPTCYQAVEMIKNELNKEGFIELNENEKYQLVKGGQYYVDRNGSSIIAFKIGDRLENMSYQMVASHSDVPSFKVKPRNKKASSGYELINTEVYGGPIYNTWMDRFLGLAGRVVLESADGVKVQNIQIKKPICMIPNMSIHMNRGVNDGVKLNPQIDMLPMMSRDKEFDLMEYVAEYLNVERSTIVDTDLFLYPIEKGQVWGQNDEFVSSFHLDDLQCAYTTLQGFIQGGHQDSVSVYCCFDNEEVGSRTKQGADSTFLMDTLNRINGSLGLSEEDLLRALASSIIVSADNAHAIIPSHPEKFDPTNFVEVNEGIVIKYNANQSYSTDGLSASLFQQLCKSENVQFQTFTNRSDERGGGTLGAINTSHVSILSVDIGCPQLAMHSVLETAGTKDTIMMIDAMTEFFNAHLIKVNSQQYKVVR